ncbi:hypothetical protein A33M_0117 [Rhodovulum sp. PH10]|nr:hypothetical protein A33M_0117 [Rhodovulum sp. PH10]
MAVLKGANRRVASSESGRRASSYSPLPTRYSPLTTTIPGRPR